MRSVFEYSDYRTFLKDAFLELKSGPSGFSYARFCEAIGLKSTNYMKLVIDGKRNLTPGSVVRLGHFLKLGFEELRFLDALVSHGHSEGALERQHYKACLSALLDGKPTRYDRKERMELLERWYYPALLVALHGCEPSRAIQRACELVGLGDADAKRAIETLVSLSVVKLESDGRYRMSDLNVLMIDKKGTKQRYQRFLKDQLALSSRKLETQYGRGAQFFSQTISIAEESWPDYVSQVQGLLDRFARQSDSEPAEKLVQLNAQLFHLVAPRKRPKDEGRL
jgi:uncharacterized protein (TIGR02147 family)